MCGSIRYFTRTDLFPCYFFVTWFCQCNTPPSASFLYIHYMGVPLYDITLYYEGKTLKDSPGKQAFAITANYLCDFYHQLLAGYKPPKTSRICIHAAPQKNWVGPLYHGSICSIAVDIDEQKYIHLRGQDKLEYALNLIHAACLELCQALSWDKMVFERAYQKIIDQQYRFMLEYPYKKSKDRRTSARVVIEKTPQQSFLHIDILAPGNNDRVTLITKRNWFWSDSVYEFAKHSKWLDKSAFGVSTVDNQKYGYYSVLDKVIIGNLLFSDNDF